MALDKVGVQIMGGWSGNLGRCRTVKLINVSADYVGQVRRTVGPECEIYVRFEYDDPPIDGLNAEGAAIQWFSRRVTDMRGMRTAAGGRNIIFELPKNEPPTSLLPALVRFYVTLLPLMHREGLPVAVGNCSVGEWKEGEWYRFAPIIAQLTPQDRLSVHEYWSDYDDIDNRWHCGRWTQPQIAAVIGKTPIIVSECGRDITPDTGKGLRGWRKSCDGAQFLRDLTKYNALLEQYSQVRGCQVFIVGQHWWPDFDPSPVWPQVVALYSNPQAYPGVSVPVQVPPPQPYQPAKVTAPGVTYVDWYKTANWCERVGHTVKALVIHGTEKAKGAGISATLSWWASLSSEVSGHDVVAEDGTVYRCLGYDRAAWAVGKSVIPGLTGGRVIVGPYSVDRDNLESISFEWDHCSTPGVAYPKVQWDAGVAHVKALVAQYHLTREQVWRHGEIRPTSSPLRSEPRDLDWQAFMDSVFGPVSAPVETPEEGENVEEKIRNAAWNALGVPLNPDAAFQKYAREHNLGAPLTMERYIWLDPVNYCYQGYMGGVVWAAVGDWANVKHLAW